MREVFKDFPLDYQVMVTAELGIYIACVFV